MTSSFLKKFRVAFSAVILICFILVFVDFRSLIPGKYINFLVYLQFIPSLIKYIDIKTITAGGFFVVILLTLLSGRTYCSFLCPLGVWQDVFSRTGGKTRKKFRRYGFKKPHTVLRYMFLIITIGVSFIWGLYAVTILDPYSIFGRFITFFIKPVVILANNFLAGILERFDNYTLSHVPVRAFDLLSYSVPVALFLLIGILSFVKGRLYCNIFCPVGTFLGLLSKVSLLRIRINETTCTKCGRCSIACKSNCIDSLYQNIDITRCVDCFNCISSCPDKAISYSLVGSAHPVQKTDESKRRFVASTLLILFGISGFAKYQQKIAPVPKKVSTVKEGRTTPVCPPGAGSIEHFTKNCTACSLCITACPNNVLQPAVKQYGIAGLMQPVMDYHKSFCTYNCTVCTEICPTNALKPLMLDAKKLTQIGKTNFIKDNCIVKTEKTACGACSEACPTKAVYMIPYEGNLLIPEINQEICIGCGHCEYACPTSPYKAIFVDGNPVHQAAKKPENKESEIKEPLEFPF